MAIVEHHKQLKFPPFVWARGITASAIGREIEVSGIIPILEKDHYAAPDPLRAYMEAINRHGGAKRQGKNSPHIQFANANNIEEQLAFIKRYGPLVVSSARMEERAITPEGPFDFKLTETLIVARQNVAELETEHRIYRAALELISQLRSKVSDIATVRDCISRIVNNVSEWPKQWERERQLRTSGLGYSGEPQWNFAPENLRHMEFCMWRAMRGRSGDPLKDAFSELNPVRDGHSVICEIVNAFAPVVYPWGHSPVEAQHWDLAAGIRPVLYYMLRREYLTWTGIGICRNSDCRHVFEIERSGQEFCGEECSRLQRQREYWGTRGKKLRQRRLAKRERGGSTGRRKMRKEQ